MPIEHQYMPSAKLGTGAPLVLWLVKNLPDCRRPRFDPGFNWLGKIKKKKKASRHWVHNTKLINTFAQKTHKWDGEKDRGIGDTADL